MAERREAKLAVERGEAAEAAAGDVLEKDALDRILGAEGEDLVQGRFLQRGHRPPKL